MPLKRGHSPEVVSHNVKEMVKAGYKQKQAVATALSHARKYQKMADGGEVKGYMANYDTAPKIETAISKNEGMAASKDRYPYNLAHGGMIEESDLDADADEGMGSVGAGSDEGMPGMAVYPQGMDDEGLSADVEHREALTKGLQAALMGANNNRVSFKADAAVSGSPRHESGLKQSKADDAMGNIPELEWEDESVEEPMSAEGDKPAAMGHAPEQGVPMSMALSEEAKKAIEAKKAKRKFGMYNPR